jgi:primosomal protein N' (replication factor Y)
VISADTQMLLPDFRASERTFQLLTQVAGRAGRSALAGEVVIQSFQPGHESLTHVGAHDFVSFYQQELPLRKELEYPPFTRIVLIEFRGEKEENVMRHATWVSERLHAAERNLRILGPAPAVIAKVRSVFRWHIVVKDSKERDPSGKRLHRIFRQTIDAYRSDRLGKSRSVKVVIDIDPVGMM